MYHAKMLSQQYCAEWDTKNDGYGRSPIMYYCDRDRWKDIAGLSSVRPLSTAGLAVGGEASRICLVGPPVNPDMVTRPGGYSASPFLSWCCVVMGWRKIGAAGSGDVSTCGFSWKLTTGRFSSKVPRGVDGLDDALGELEELPTQ